MNKKKANHSKKSRKAKEHGDHGSRQNLNDFVDLPDDFWEKEDIKMKNLKKSINLRLDDDIFQFFKDGGKGYQTRINAVLRSYVQAMKNRIK